MVTWFVGNSSENSDGIPTTITVISVNQNVVGSLSWLKRGLGRITDSIVPGDGVVVFYVGRSVRVWDCGEEYAGLSEVGSQWDRCASSG
ncbi:unnamed protein product [Brassica oleracea var. botrytis]